MNGRIYDPLLGRFLSADVLVTNAANLQAYNRYSYVQNNPLTWTDPSGFAPEDTTAGVITGSVKPLISQGYDRAVQNNNEAASSKEMLALLCSLVGLEQTANRLSGEAREHREMNVGMDKREAAAVKTLDDVASNLTGSTDVNQPDRVAADHVSSTVVRTALVIAPLAAPIAGAMRPEARMKSADVKSPDAGKGTVPKAPPTIHEGKQGKHIPGHNNFQPGKSELTHPDPQALVDTHAGTGQRNGQREHVDTGEVVGVHVAQDGTRTDTTRITIHYGKDDKEAHIVPAVPQAPPPPPPPKDPKTP